MKRILLLCTGALALSLLAACGQPPGQAQQAAEHQLALAATVAAAPTQATASEARPTQAPATSTPNTQASAHAATEVAAATAGSAPPTDAPTEAPTTPQQPSAAPTEAPTTAPTIAPSPAPTAPPPTAIPPTAIPPTAIPPTAAPTEAVAQIDCSSPCSISFSELYSGASITGPIVSAKARALAGQRVIMRGFMAPPLSPSTTFFVLTKDPMVYCPFCNTAADWPFDIVYVKMAGGKQIPTMVPTTNLAVTGTFQVGTWTDPETGFVSLIRIIADKVEPIS